MLAVTEYGQGERQEALRRFFALSNADQLRAFAEIKGHLASAPGKADELDRVIARRAEALAALEAVARDLRERGHLTSGKAPTAKQFDEVARHLGLVAEAGGCWSRARVVRAYGSWRSAQAALLGERVPPSAEQRQQRRDIGLTRRRSEEPMVALKTWLNERPVSKARTDYDEFAKAQNRDQRKIAGERLPLARSIVVELAMNWTDCLRAAQSPGGLEGVRSTRRIALLDSLDDGELIGSVTIAALLDQSYFTTRALLRREGFPAPVAEIGRMRAWLVGDIKRFRLARPFPQRNPSELQKDLFGTTELAKCLSLDRDYLRAMLAQQNWARLPKPAGRVGPAHYWWRDAVEKWMNAKP